MSDYVSQIRAALISLRDYSKGERFATARIAPAALDVLEAEHAETKRRLDECGRARAAYVIPESDGVWLTRDEAKQIQNSMRKRAAFDADLAAAYALLDKRIGDK